MIDYNKKNDKQNLCYLSLCLSQGNDKIMATLKHKE